MNMPLPQDRHVTHTGEIVTGQRLIDARNKVADDWKQNAYAVREDDDYAQHITEQQKDFFLFQSLQLAEEIRWGNESSFTVWQRINTELTGECIAFLPKG